jgi:hypothetical protein
MKYTCLGYIKPGRFENMSESERNTMLDERFSCSDELRKNVSRDSTMSRCPNLNIAFRKASITLRHNPW